MSQKQYKAAPKNSEKPPSVIERDTTIRLDDGESPFVEIKPTGDVLLDVTFDNSKSLSRFTPSPPSSLRPAILLRNTRSCNSRTIFRVHLDTLKGSSKYFRLLLGSSLFAEGSNIFAAHTSLEAIGILPADAKALDLPRISITDDDDATRIAGREVIFEDLLWILHGSDIKNRPSILYLTMLAVMADRFDCTQVIGNYVRRLKKIPWPQTYGITTTAEETLRQKILLTWLLDDQVRFASATRELIIRGSLRWAGEQQPQEYQEIWWDLQDGLETELNYRRTSILACICSLQNHFLARYTSRERQCKHFYDSSAACDSFQLGEMIKFFTSKGILSLTSPLSTNIESIPDTYSGDIDNLITLLRQCPSYQIDKNHTHCGLRARLIPALDYIQAMLMSNIGIDRRGWNNDRPGTTWELHKVVPPQTFTFTRSIARDQRLKLDGYLVANRYHEALFTARDWNWTPED